LLALGGGVTGDLGGFAASIYMRGIQFVQCPTTFLAQVDAGIGGKTAIDFKGIKNLIGSFYQPKVVLADTAVLKTLSDRQFKTDWPRSLNMELFGTKRCFSKLESKLKVVLQRNPKILSELIRRSCEIKAQIVSRRRTGKR
jgi:3-dehydroquinate synthetase